MTTTNTTQEELLQAMDEVLRISDRKHDAWDRAKELIAEARRTPPVEQPAEVTHGGVEGLKVVVTCNMSGQCVCVSRQDPEGRIHEVIWEAEQPAEGMKDAVKWRSRAYRLSQIKVGENDEDYWARIDADNVSTSIESHLASKREQPVVAKMETTEPTPDQRRIEAMRGKIKALCPELRDIGRDDLADKCIEIAGDMAYVPTLSKPAPAQELPELPPSTAYVKVWIGEIGERLESANSEYYTADKMHTYGQQCADQATDALRAELFDSNRMFRLAHIELTTLREQAELDAKDTKLVKDWVCHNGGLLNEWAKEWHPECKTPLVVFIRQKLDAAIAKWKGQR